MRKSKNPITCISSPEAVMSMENVIQIIQIPKITLNWSEWTPWYNIVEDADIPNHTKGVYEVKIRNQEKRLQIGKSSNLRRRIRQGLIKGKAKHSSGKRIREKEDLDRIVVRWATTEYPSAVEEELHKKHHERFGGLPEYVKLT